MNKFKGFTDAETFTQLPDKFFHQLLKEIKDADELKVTLYLLWRVGHAEGPFRALSKMDFDVKVLGLAAEGITRGLEKAIQRGSILKVEMARVEPSRNDAAVYFLLNSPRGRAAVEAIKNGKWNPAVSGSTPPIERPNMFKLYEENIGPLTPLIADTLKDAENLYSDEWVADAIELAAKNNKRNWKYCEAVLKRWKEEGRHGKKGKQDAIQGSERYTKSEFAEYLKGD